jgi:hypothetical protein
MSASHGELCRDCGLPVWNAYAELHPLVRHWVDLALRVRNAKGHDVRPGLPRRTG